MPSGERNVLPVLDRVAAVRSMGGDESMFETFIDLFIEDSANQIAVMEDAIAEDDAERLERAAHSLKGAAATMHAERIREVADRLEMMSHDKAISDAGAVLTCLLHELSALKEYVKSL
jgi:HPt (histidine-containing phosphotransfer) domain-containing protein